MTVLALPNDLIRERLWVLEADIDDATPEQVAAACELLRTAGALDVVVLMVGMKKGRSGVRLSVLAADETAVDSMSVVLLRETPTLGLRSHPVERLSLARETREVLLFGEHPVRVKIALWEGKSLKAKVEHDDLVAVAACVGRSLLAVQREADRAVAEVLI